MFNRDKFFKKTIKNPTSVSKYLYYKFRNQVVSEQHKFKIKYYQSYFEKHKTNMKMLRTGIKSIVNVKPKTQFSPISHLVNNGTRINDPVKMANIFNNYFINVGSQIDETIPRTKKSPTDYLKNRIPESIFLAPVTREEIEIIVNSLNVKKAIGGPYSIPVFLLKILSRLFSQPLSVIVNQSFEVGIFPNKLKVGRVNPLYKKTPVIIHLITDQFLFSQCFLKSLRN